MNPRNGFLRRTATRTFRDRHEAGRALAEELTAYRGKDNVLVLGLARGGLPVAWEIASALSAALDVFLVRKLGVPRWSGARDGRTGQRRRCGDERQRGFQPAHHRRAGARGDRQRDGRVVATRARVSGRATRSPIRGTRSSSWSTTASPPAPACWLPFGRSGQVDRNRSSSPSRSVRSQSAANSRQVADDVVCTTMPPAFEAVGQVYGDFHQVSDDEVRQLLNTPTR